jgi:hypothetical protein
MPAESAEAIWSRKDGYPGLEIMRSSVSREKGRPFPLTEISNKRSVAAESIRGRHARFPKKQKKTGGENSSPVFYHLISKGIGFVG